MMMMMMVHDDGPWWMMDDGIFNIFAFKIDKYHRYQADRYQDIKNYPPIQKEPHKKKQWPWMIEALPMDDRGSSLIQIHSWQWLPLTPPPKNKWWTWTNCIRSPSPDLPKICIFLCSNHFSHIFVSPKKQTTAKKRLGPTHGTDHSWLPICHPSTYTPRDSLEAVLPSDSILLKVCFSSRRIRRIRGIRWGEDEDFPLKGPIREFGHGKIPISHRKNNKIHGKIVFLVEDFGEESYVFGERNCLDHQDYPIKSMKVSWNGMGLKMYLG